MNKFNAQKTKIGQYTFDSKKEAGRFMGLRLLVRAGEITDLKVHPKFILQEGFIYHGRKIQPITYTADFMYQEKGITIVEDVKGMQTQLFKVKWKMAKYKYPELIFRIVV